MVIFFYYERVRYLSMVSQHIHLIISQSDWLRLFGALTTLSVIRFQLLKFTLEQSNLEIEVCGTFHVKNGLCCKYII